MSGKKLNSVQSSQKDDIEPSDKSKSPSWGVIILLLILFWPVGLFLLVKRLVNDNDVKFTGAAKDKIENARKSLDESMNVGIDKINEKLEQGAKKTTSFAKNNALIIVATYFAFSIVIMGMLTIFVDDTSKNEISIEVIEDGYRTQENHSEDGASNE